MADGSYASKGSDKRQSLAEMAARAAQRSSRPPPAPNAPPSSRSPSRLTNRPSYTPAQSYSQPSSFASHGGEVEEGSGLINLHDIARMRSLAPAVRTIDPQPVTATPASSPVAAAQAQPAGGSRYVLAGVLVALVGIGIAYGLNSQNGSREVAHQAPAAQIAPQAPVAPMEAPVAAVPQAAPVAQIPAAPVAQAPAIAAPVAANPVAPSHHVAPGAKADATEITTAAVGPRTALKGTKASRAKTGTAGGNVAAVAKEPKAEDPTKPSAGAAAIAAAMNAELGAAAPAAAAPPPAAAAAAPPPAPVAAAPAPKAAPEPEPTGLQGAMKKAVGPNTGPTPQAEVGPAPVAAAAPPRGDVPDLPAQGAIQGAMGAQRQAARSCLQGQEAPSRATIVFASSGSVQSVTLSGPAAGTPAEACVKAAMSKLVIGPFRRPTFSFSTTISPP